MKTFELDTAGMNRKTYEEIIEGLKEASDSTFANALFGVFAQQPISIFKIAHTLFQGDRDLINILNRISELNRKVDNKLDKVSNTNNEEAINELKNQTSNLIEWLHTLIVKRNEFEFLWSKHNNKDFNYNKLFQLLQDPVLAYAYLIDFNRLTDFFIKKHEGTLKNHSYNEIREFVLNFYLETINSQRTKILNKLGQEDSELNSKTGQYLAKSISNQAVSVCFRSLYDTNIEKENIKRASWVGDVMKDFRDDLEPDFIKTINKAINDNSINRYALPNSFFEKEEKETETKNDLLKKVH